MWGLVTKISIGLIKLKRASTKYLCLERRKADIRESDPRKRRGNWKLQEIHFIAFSRTGTED